MGASRDVRDRRRELLESVDGPRRLESKEYDAVLDKLVTHFRLVGSVSEEEDTDFSISRYVTPTSEITVVADPKIGASLVSVAVDALNEIGKPLAITFDTGSYICVLSTGHVLGYSDWEDLSGYGFPYE